MAITKSSFGTTKNGEDVYLFSLKNKNGMEVQIITFGGAIISLTTPDKNGHYDDIILGYDNISSYENSNNFLGSIIGRCSNIIENAKFKINNIEYNLDKNYYFNGFNSKVWVYEVIIDYDNILRLSYISKDGECGFPGNMKVDVTYLLLEDNTLRIDYKAISDKDTLVNLTNQTYFNLGGHTYNTILDHKLLINSDKFIINDKNFIHTGKVKNIENTPMDFLNLKSIKEHINMEDNHLLVNSSYNNNWILNSNGNMEILAAKVVHDKSGRVMEIYTSKPALQFYSGNYLDDAGKGKSNVIYKKRGGFCIQTQYIPNSINIPSFPSPVLKANRIYRHTTIYKFDTL